MRKISLLFFCFMLAAFAFGQQGLITDFTGGNQTPLVTRGDFVLRGTVLVGYLGNAANVTIPANLGITEIGDSAFIHAGITSIVIPEGVQRIGANAFLDCYDLVSVTLPRSVTFLGSSAFYWCGLTSISLPANLAIIGDFAFAKNNITSVNIPSNVTVISYSAFSDNDDLSSITVPANIPYVSSVVEDNGFGSIYNNNSRRAGTYLWGFGGWRTGTGAPPSTNITLGIAYNATLQNGGEQIYRVNIPSGGVRLTAYTQGSIDTQMWIYDADGKERAYDDDSGSGSNARASIIVSAGNCYIKIRGYGNAAGDYSLTVSTEIVQATNITPGTAYSATLQSGGEHLYRVTVPSGRVRLTAYTESGIDTQMWIYDDGWKELAYDDDSGSGNNARISINVSAGTYFISIKGYDRNDAGAYSLSVTTQNIQ